MFSARPLFFFADAIPCSDGMCGHKGTCWDKYDGTFFCQCDWGYTGVFCDTETPGVLPKNLTPTAIDMIFRIQCHRLLKYLKTFLVNAHF